MERTKKEKYEQEIRKSIKTILNLQPELVQFLKNLPLKNDNLLNRSFPYIHGLKLLRIFTLMEINYIIFSFLDIIEKTKVLKVQNLKIGLIGGGVMGRLILNTLLVFTRQGLKTQNILVSTRQPQHLQFYTEHFGIKTFFDNEKIAKQCDLIFVATPATLDNWIIADLKKHIQTRINSNQSFQTNHTSCASTVAIQHSQPLNKLVSSVQTDLEKGRIGDTQNLALIKTSKKITTPIKQDPITLSPLLYILTSDITEQKSNKIFSFPLMVPWLRATDISSVLEKIKTNLSTKNTKDLSENSENIIKELENLMSEQITIPKHKKQSLDKDTSLLSFSRIDNLISTLAFCCKKLENNWRLNIAFLKPKSQCEPHEINKLYNDILKSQGSYQETFLTKSRKWRMAYNNFIV